MTTTARRAPPAIEGHCDPRFGPVREAFASNFAELDEIGAAVAVRVGDRPVVDLWGGHRDGARRQPWTRDTLVNSYSVGKGVLAVLVAALVERGAIDLDGPVAGPWPEFATQGKAGVTIRALLAHRAGLPAVRRRLPERAMYDWQGMCHELASQAPYWEPDSDHGYHVNTYGFLAGELVCRATGTDIGDALRRHVTGPLSADFHWGLARSEHARVARVVAPDVALTRESEWATAFPATGDDDYDHMNWHCYFNPSGLSGIGSVNTPEWRLAAIPSTNGHGTARAVAAIYAAFLAGDPRGARLAGPGVRAAVTAIHSDGRDRVLRRHTRYGLGFQLSQPGRPLGPNAASFGHYGYGGSLGFADPETDLAFGYLMNRPGPRWQTPRTQRLIDAVYACL